MSQKEQNSIYTKHLLKEIIESNKIRRNTIKYIGTFKNGIEGLIYGGIDSIAGLPLLGTTNLIYNIVKEIYRIEINPSEKKDFYKEYWLKYSCLKYFVHFGTYSLCNPQVLNQISNLIEKWN